MQGAKMGKYEVRIFAAEETHSNPYIQKQSSKNNITYKPKQTLINNKG